MHTKIGKAVSDSNVDVLVCSGENAKFIAEEANKNNVDNQKQIIYFEDKSEILKYLIDNTKSGDVILFKASNGMKFFELCNKYVQSVTENQD